MNLFAYGTLQFPELLYAVCGQRCSGEAALLRGHRREGVRGEVYPAIIRSPGAVVDGMLFRGLTPTALRALDAFEGREYRRVRGRVALDAHRHVPAVFYVAAPTLRVRLDGRPWDARRFASSSLSAYLTRCRRERSSRRRSGRGSRYRSAY